MKGALLGDRESPATKVSNEATDKPGSATSPEAFTRREQND